MIQRWMYDVLLGLQRIEAIHGPGDTCVADLLELVPLDVQNEATAIGNYLAVRPRLYPPCSHRPNAAADNLTPCGECTHKKVGS